MASYTTVSALFTAICDAIRAKENSTGSINHQDIPDRIAAIPAGGSDSLTEELSNREYKYYNDETYLRVNDSVVYMPLFAETQYVTSIDIEHLKMTPLTASFCNCPRLKELKLPELNTISAGNTISNLAALETLELGAILRISYSNSSVFNKLGVAELAIPGTDGVAGVRFPASSASECKQMKKLTLGEGWRYLQQSFGRDNPLLEYVELPASIQEIGNYSLRNNPRLETLVLKSTAVPTCGASVLAGSKIASGSGYIYVLDTLVEDYKVATNWSAFAAQFKGMSELPA